MRYGADPAILAGIDVLGDASQMVDGRSGIPNLGKYVTTRYNQL